VPDRQPGISITGMNIRPKSRGRVEMRSRDAADSPIVHANWLTDPQDRSDVVAMVRAIKRMMRQPELSDFVGEEVYPGDPPTRLTMRFSRRRCSPSAARSSVKARSAARSDQWHDVVARSTPSPIAETLGRPC
jgi:choline dehydrogenase-like flavoprotein